MKNKLSYYAKYTAGSYLDALSSIPIFAGEKIAQVSERLFGKRNPRFLSLAHIHEKSPIFRGRQRLRETLDTRAGALYLQSNVIGAIPFMLAGIPAAEIASYGIERCLSEAPEVVKCVTNSLATLTAQMVTGYSVYMANEVRVNPQKYSKDGKLSKRKIAKGVIDSVKAFLSFDLSFIGSKTAGQSAMIYSGKDPGIASAIFDTISIPIWYTIAIPLGLKTGIIETKDNKKNSGEIIIENGK